MSINESVNDCGPCRKRMTAHECLAHRWLAGEGAASRTTPVPAHRLQLMRDRLRARYEVSISASFSSAASSASSASRRPLYLTDNPLDTNPHPPLHYSTPLGTSFTSFATIVYCVSLNVHHSRLTTSTRH